MHCELVEKKEVIVNMDSRVFLTQKSSSSSYIAAGSGWAGWACAHPDFAGVEKRTETEIDNDVLFDHYNLVPSGTSEPSATIAERRSHSINI